VSYPKIPAQTLPAGLLAMQEALKLPFGFIMEIDKEFPWARSRGLAASAVGAVVAANALLAEPVSKLELLKFAMQGEAVASGSLHVDNIRVVVWRVGVDGGNRPSAGQTDPGAARCARRDHAPAHVSVDQQARAILKRTVDLSDFVWQTANLAGFISGCYTNDLDMIRASLEDVVIEPQRQALIPGFQDVRRAAMEAAPWAARSPAQVPPRSRGT